MNVFNNCIGRNITEQLTWMNEPDKWGFNEDNKLEILAPKNADFFLDPAGYHKKASAPFLYLTPENDFILTTQVTVEMDKPYDSGCLMIMIDHENWAKLCFEYIDGYPTIVSVVTKKISDDCVSERIAIKSPYLRITKKDNCFAFHYSNDGQIWTMARYFGFEKIENLKVGVVAQCPMGSSCNVTFDWLEHTSKTVEDLRISQ